MSSFSEDSWTNDEEEELQLQLYARELNMSREPPINEMALMQLEPKKEPEPSKEWDEKQQGSSEDGPKTVVKEGEKENDTPGVLRIMRNVAIRGKAPDGLGTRMLKTMRCPLPNCCKTLKEWFCEGCFLPVEFSLDGWCRCDCGEYSISGAMFRCNSKRHYFLSKVAPFCPEEYYYVGVISAQPELKKKLIGHLTGGVGCSTRYRQQILQPIDVAKDGNHFREINAVCIVVPDDQTPIRSELIEAHFLLGGEAGLKNVIICCERAHSRFIPIKSDANEYSLLALHSDLQLPTLQMSNLNTVDLQSFLFNVSSLKPVYRLDVMCRAGSQETIELIMGLVDICKPLLKSIDMNIKFHKDGSIRHKRAFVQTYNTSDRNFVHELADVVKLEGEQGYELSFGDWRVDIFMVLDPLQEGDQLDADLLELEQREIGYHLQQLNDLLKVDRSMAGSSYSQLHTICGRLVASRYCREVVEYFKSRAQEPMQTSSGGVTVFSTEPVEDPMHRQWNWNQ